jgi:hypothetical protein
MEAQRVLLQLDRILASAAFANAGRASSFLRFVVELTLAGRAGEIKESVIAVEVLSRPSSFDSKSDPIVRVEPDACVIGSVPTTKPKAELTRF